MPTIEFSDFRFSGTVEECAAFVIALRSPKPASAPAPRIKSSEAWPLPAAVSNVVLSESKPQPPTQLDDQATAQLAIRLLRQIRDHSNSGGVDGQFVAKILGVSHPKGIAYPASRINRLLENSGFEVSAVYQNRRGSTGARNWLAGPRLNEALDQLELFYEGEPTTAKD